MTHLRLKRICSNNAIQLTGAAALAFKKRSQACERWILKSPFFNDRIRLCCHGTVFSMPGANAFGSNLGDVYVMLITYDPDLLAGVAVGESTSYGSPASANLSGLGGLG